VIALQPTPFVVQVVEAPTRETSVVDVLMGSIGLIGVITLAMVLVGALFGGLFVVVRQRLEARKADNAPEGVQLHLSGTD
jgi:hypothetical protein